MEKPTICATHYEIKSSALAILHHKKEFIRCHESLDEFLAWVDDMCADILAQAGLATDMGKRMEKALERKNKQIKELSMEGK